MSALKDLFAMTRHERRGAVALLALIAVGLASLWLVRSRPLRPTPPEAAAMRQFEVEVAVDTARQASAGRDKKPAAAASKPAKKPATAKPLHKPSASDRQLTPAKRLRESKKTEHAGNE